MAFCELIFHDFGSVRHNYSLVLSPVGNLIVGLVCASVQTHISITAGRYFLILGMVMSEDLGMMPVISKF